MSEVFKVVDKITQEKWNEAQRHELHEWDCQPSDGDDWNNWWKDKFDDYKFLEGETNTHTVMEIGSGPWARNLENVLNTLPVAPKKIIIEDPLLDEYIKAGKSVKRFKDYHSMETHLISKPFEQCDGTVIEPKSVDIIVCNNVLDHVYDVGQIFDNIYAALKEGGLLILGQDLKNETDKFVEDVMHPILLDHDCLDKLLNTGYTTQMYKILEREKGRNPEYHYGTYLFVGRKV